MIIGSICCFLRISKSEISKTAITIYSLANFGSSFEIPICDILTLQLNGRLVIIVNTNKRFIIPDPLAVTRRLHCAASLRYYRYEIGGALNLSALCSMKCNVAFITRHITLHYYNEPEQNIIRDIQQENTLKRKRHFEISRNRALARRHQQFAEFL